jgi:hypothetical protein
LSLFNATADNRAKLRWLRQPLVEQPDQTWVSRLDLSVDDEATLEQQMGLFFVFGFSLAL